MLNEVKPLNGFFADAQIYSTIKLWILTMFLNQFILIFLDLCLNYLLGLDNKLRDLLLNVS